MESEERPEKTAAEPEATTTAAGSATVSAGTGSGAGALAAMARTAAARRRRSRPARRCVRDADVRPAASPHGARLGLERCERDQRLAEAAVRVREAEKVVEQGPRPTPSAEAAVRVPSERIWG